MQRVDDVLIIDDDEDLLEAMAEVLGTVGRLRVQSARSGREALRLYARDAPALVILDERLADMRGSELLALLRRTDARASRPALFLTGAKEGVRCLPSDVILVKPVDAQELLDAVCALVPCAT